MAGLGVPAGIKAKRVKEEGSEQTVYSTQQNPEE